MMAYFTIPRRHLNKGLFTITLAILCAFLLSACSGSPQIQQKATQSKANLDSLLAHAQSIGVPSSMLQTIRSQEIQLSSANAPTSIFTDQPINDYYSNLAQRYQTLAVQVRGLESQVAQQFDYQASLDLQNFENILAVRHAEGFIEAKTFANQLTQDQKLLAQAQFPKDYLQISNSAKQSTQALHLMGPAYNSLTSLQQNIKDLQDSHLDVTALNQQAQDDVQLFRNATGPDDYSQLIDQIGAQLQETASFSTQAIPYVGAAKLQQFSIGIKTLKQYGQDTTSFQKQLDADQNALNTAQSVGDLLKVSSKIDSDISALQFALIKGQANYVLKQFSSEVTNWGNAHRYLDPNDGNTYYVDYEYATQGIGSDAASAVQSAQTPDDYQAAIDLINNDLIHLRAMEADYNDRTSWDQPHATDLQLMRHYTINSGEVLVVSLIEQSLRYYNNGKLVRSFLITSGQFDKPSPPGLWSIFLRQSPTVFKSSEPKGSAFWYPDTNIHYAMEYHDGGYFFHDSWWRADYGPGTNFPHYDSGGDESFAGNGSHGCINMQEQDAAWLYGNTTYGATVIVY